MEPNTHHWQGKNKQIKISLYFSLLSQISLSPLSHRKAEIAEHTTRLKFCFEQNALSLLQIHAQTASLDKHFSVQEGLEKMEEEVKT